jgi:hypothetical protein
MIHASLDRLEELLGSSKRGTSYGRFQKGSHWLGCISPMEEFEVSVILYLLQLRKSYLLLLLKHRIRCFLELKIYGYVTSSDVKILALIEREGIVPLKKRKEIDIKILFVCLSHDTK